MARRHTVKRDQLDRDLAAIQDIRDALKPIEGWRQRARIILFVLREIWPSGYFMLREHDTTEQLT